MQLTKRLMALLLVVMTLCCIPAMAEDAEDVKLVERSELLDVAFSMLEKGNPILAKYNEITGAEIEPYFETGLPYFFGGKHDQTVNGVSRVFCKYPEFSKRVAWETTHFYRKGKYYLYGLDCTGYTNWILSELGKPGHDSLSNMILQDKYAKSNHIYNSKKGKWAKPMPAYNELASTLQVGDLLAAKQGSRHIMMFIGTLREYGYTAENAPELADYLDYTLVIHSGPNPEYGKRIQAYLDAHKDDSYYSNVLIPNGGVCVSLIGVPTSAAPHQVEDSKEMYYYFDLDGYKVTIWDLMSATSFCWYRPDGVEQ